MVDMGKAYEDDRCGPVVVFAKVEIGRSCNRFKDTSRCLKMKRRGDCPLDENIGAKCRCSIIITDS